MSCDTGTGAYLGFTVVTAQNCSTAATNVTAAQANIRVASAAATVSSLVKVRSFGSWTVSQDVFDAPRLADGCGSFRYKRYGCDLDHGPFSCVIEFNGEFEISLLVGAEGTIRRTNPDGSYWEGTGRCISATAMTDSSADSESLGEMEWQFTGGSTSDPSFTTAP